MVEKEEFTLTVFTENKPGILSRVVGLVTRRHINIDSIVASESSIEGIHKIIIVIQVLEEQARKIVAQIDKQVDVLKAFYYNNEEIVYQEMALYKVPVDSFINGNSLETIVRKHDAKILRIEKEYIVIEKTGHKEDTEALLTLLQKTGVYEFVRTGKIAIAKPMEQLNSYLKNIESN